jgi:ribulose 1,5-bisphosphate synthetase/thiazole synthase
MGIRQLPAQSIPVLAEVDAVVVGGSFAGVSCALKLASQGKRVMVVESRTYLGREMTATLTPWMEVNKQGYTPELVKRCVNYCGKELSFGNTKYISFQIDNLKKHLEDILLASRAQLLYASLAIGVIHHNEKLQGLMIANKSGRQLIRCKTIIDTTETAITSLLTNKVQVDFREQNESIYKRVLEFDYVQHIPQQEISIPEDLQLNDNKIKLIPGFHENGHFYVEYEMLLSSENSLESDRNRECKAQKAGMELAHYLIRNVPAFHKALLSSSSNELKGPFLKKENEIPELNVENIKLPIPNVWCFYQTTNWHDPIEASSYGEEFAHMLNNIKGEYVDVHHEIQEEKQNIDFVDYEVKIPTDFIEKPSDFTKVPVQNIPYFRKTELLVAGAGSSGGIASIRSAEEGIDTLLIDLNPGFGGTGTFGGVDSYWFGKRHGYAKRITDLVNKTQEKMNYKGHKWNIEAKKHALLNEATDTGVSTLFNVITFGAITRGSQVCGVVVATRWGTCSILADCVVDATGDGDIAAFAGAEFVYGSSRDHVTMWYSLAQFKQPGKTQNNFTSMVNISDINDYTRAILAGRRRDRGDGCHDHGIYVAPRESRHVIGDVVMTMTDQLLQRSWPDVINVHFSNHDMKGVSDADWMNTGFIPPNLEIEIPYRMLLPKGLDGILIAGKAISATHDALPAIRMQSDLENLGGIVALAAAIAIKEKQLPREININQLQGKIIEEGLMPENLLNRRLEKLIYTDDDLKQLIDMIETEQPLYDYSNMRMNEVYTERIPFVEICSVGDRIIPLLEKEHKQADGVKKVRMAQALAMYESKEGVPTLIKEIASLLQGEELPKRTADILYVTTPPDHGAMSDVCYLLYSLGMAKDKRSLPIWKRVVELLNPSEEDFKDSWLGIFYYIHAVCSGAERLGDKDAIPILEKVHQISYLNGQESTVSYQVDYFLERRAMLELTVGRALARCGSKKGYQILINYLDDVRSLLSKQAYSELKQVSGQALVKDKEVWGQWLIKQDHVHSCPYLERCDLGYSNETIFRKFKSERLIEKENYSGINHLSK